MLSLLYGKPGQTFFTNEIVRWAEMGKGSITRELERMHNAGLLVVTRKGNQTHYQSNHSCPIYAELLGVVRKTFGVADMLKAALLPVRQQIHAAFIYGSLAKDEATGNSDIDLMLIGEELSYGSVMELLEVAERSLGRTINSTLYTPQEFARKAADGNSFVTRILAQPRIQLIGECISVPHPKEMLQT